MSQYIRTPFGTAATYPDFADFPAGAPNGSLAFDEATNILYVYETDNNSWNAVQGAGAGSVTAVTATTPLMSSGGTTPNISIQVADTSEAGYLTAADWNTFNSKQPSGNYLTALTGDVSATGPGSAVASLTAITNSTLTTLTSLSLPLSQTTGILPIANGGTNSGTALINGKIMMSNAGAIVETSNIFSNGGTGLSIGGPLTDPDLGGKIFGTEYTSTATSAAFEYPANNFYELNPASTQTGDYSAMNNEIALNPPNPATNMNGYYYGLYNDAAAQNGAYGGPVIGGLNYVHFDNASSGVLSLGQQITVTNDGTGEVHNSWGISIDTVQATGVGPNPHRAALLMLGDHTFLGDNNGATASGSTVSNECDAIYVRAGCLNATGTGAANWVINSQETHPSQFMGSISAQGLITPTLQVSNSPTSGFVLTSDASGNATWQVTSVVSPLTTKGDLYGFSTTNTRVPVGANGQVLSSDSTQAEGLSWITPAAGTVISVGLTLPSSVFTVTGSPVNNTGTLTGSFNTQSANQVLGSPNGSSGVPSFRALVAADIPSLPYASSTLTNSHILVGNGSNVATDVPVSGDLTLANTGAFTVANIQGTAVSGTTGSTNVVFSSAPTLSNPVVGTQTQGDNSTKGASTAYVDLAVANAVSGINPAIAVQAATTAASDTSSFTYNNGVSGVGATLTSNSNNTPLTVDGYTFTALGQRLLVKNDTQSPSGAFNGIYFVTQLQASLLPLVLTRSLDYDQPSDINNTGAIPVINGTVNGVTQWVETAKISTVGTDPLVFALFSRNPATVGTVTSVSVVTANGVSGSVATATTTPAITLTLGAITPSSVAATGTVTGSNLSGTNTGDVTLAAVGSSPNANAASLSGQVLNLQPFSSTQPGVVLASGGGTTNFLRADGTWTSPGGGTSPSWGSGYYNATTGGTTPYAQWTYSTNTTSFVDPSSAPGSGSGVTFNDNGGPLTLSGFINGGNFQPGFTVTLSTAIYFISITIPTIAPAINDWMEWALADGSGNIIDSCANGTGGGGDLQGLTLKGIYSATSGSNTFKLMCKSDGGAFAGNVIDTVGDGLNHMSRAINFSIYQVK